MFPAETITDIRIKRLGVLLDILFPLLQQKMPDLTMDECAVAILYYYFSILHTDELGFDSANVVKAYNNIDPYATWNYIESHTKKISEKKIL